MKVPRREQFNRTHQREVFSSACINEEERRSRPPVHWPAVLDQRPTSKTRPWFLSVAAWICRQASKFLQIRLPGQHVEEVQDRTTDFV